VLAHAPVTPGNVEKEERQRTVHPRRGLRTVNFKTIAVRTGFPPNSKHDNITPHSL